jgi:TRAP-type C4-dicarboxylate transport system permease small subunit
VNGVSLRRAVDRSLETALILIMAASVLNVLWQVFTRFILRNPSFFTEELARFLLIWVGLLGASYASGKKMHPAITVVLEGLKGKSRLGAELIIQACVFTFSLLVMVVGGFRLAAMTFTLNQISAALRIPLGYVYLVIPLSGLLIMFYAAAAVLETLQKGREA